jgi:diacylglycerol kinase family enzyme
VTAPETTTRSETPWQRVLIVANPIAGRGRGGRIAEELRAELSSTGLEVMLHFSEAAGDIQRLVEAHARACDVCISVGGDGTLSEALAGLSETPDIPVAPFPTGTANVLSKDFGLARTPKELARAISTRRTLPLDVARVVGSDGSVHTSFLILGVGIDGMVVHDLDAHREGAITKLSYVAPIARILRSYRRPRLSVEIDGAQVEGEFGLVLVANCIHYGGIITLDPERDAGDGLWEVALLERGDIRSLLSFALRGLMGGVAGGACSIRRCQRIRITSDEPVPYQMDGGAGAYTPVELEVSSSPHRIVVPAPNGS